MSAKNRILCISYDESLLGPRKVLLEQAGYCVTPALGFAEATTICSLDRMFDLIVLGRSIPQADKTALIEMLRRNCAAPVLCVRRQLDPAVPEAQFSIDSSDGPEAFLGAVVYALGAKSKSI